MSKPTVQSVLNDPEFHKLGEQDRVSILTHLDPEFGKLSPNDQKQVMEASYGYQLANRPGVSRPGGSLPGVPAADAVNLNIGDIASSPVARFETEAAKQVGQLASNAGRQIKELPGKIMHPFDTVVTEPASVAGLALQATLAGGDSSFKRVLAGADILAGGNPVAAQQNQKAGNTAAAVADVTAIPLLSYAFGKGVDALPGIRTGEPEIFTPSNRVNLASILSQSPTTQTYLMQRGGLVDRMLPYLRMAAKENGLKSEDLAEAFPAREMEPSRPIVSGKETLANQKTGSFRVDRGVQNRYKVFSTTEQLFDRQFQTLMREYSSSPMDINSIASDVVRQITSEESTASPTLRNSLEAAARRISQYEDRSLGGLDKLRREFNKLADKSERAQEKGAVPAADLEAADAYRRAADAIRNAEYNKLAQVSGLPEADIRKLQQLHGDAVVMKRANHDATLGVQREQYMHESNAAHRVLFGRSGERTTYGKGVVSRLFKGGPQGDLNVSARRALRGLEQGGTPQKILPEMTNQKQLPHPGVEIPTEVTRVIQHGKTGAYAPARTVVGESGTPLRNPDPRLPAHYSSERVPYAGHDYVGSGTPPSEDGQYLPGSRSELPILGPTEIQGASAGTVQVATPEQARQMLNAIASADWKGIDAATRAQVEQTISDLEKLARTGETGPRSRSMKVLPGEPGRRLSRVPHTAARAGVRAGIAMSAANRRKRDLPGLEAEQ